MRETEKLLNNYQYDSASQQQPRVYRLQGDHWAAQTTQAHAKAEHGEGLQMGLSCQTDMSKTDYWQALQDSRPSRQESTHTASNVGGEVTSPNS